MFGAEGLPALLAHRGRIGAEHRTIRQAEAGGAVEHLPAPLARRPVLHGREQTAVAASGVASGGSHRDQLAIGRQFQHRLGVGLAYQLELLRGQPQIRREQQGRGAINRGLGWTRRGCGSWWGERHDPGGRVMSA